jgi:hypothetical protein
MSDIPNLLTCVNNAANETESNIIPEKHLGLLQVEDPTISRQSAHIWRWDCQTYVSAAFYPENIPVTHFCRRLNKT